MPEATQTTPDEAAVPAITFTEKAADRLEAEADKHREDGNGIEALRLIIAGGGCCGLQYAMAFATGDPEDIETVVETGAMPIYVQRDHLPMLEGSTIEWVENVMGAGFRVDNPNVDESSCGC